MVTTPKKMRPCETDIILLIGSIHSELVLENNTNTISVWIHRSSFGFPEILGSPFLVSI
jgi:hypothetical protein